MFGKGYFQCRLGKRVGLARKTTAGQTRVHQHIVDTRPESMMNPGKDLVYTLLTYFDAQFQIVDTILHANQHTAQYQTVSML